MYFHVLYFCQIRSFAFTYTKSFRLQQTFGAGVKKHGRREIVIEENEVVCRREGNNVTVVLSLSLGSIASNLSDCHAHDA